MTWITRIRLLLLLLTTVVCQATLFPDLRFFDVAPDLGLVATIAVACRIGPERGAVYGFASGLAIDLFLQTPFGLSALSFAVVGYGAGIVQGGMSRDVRFAAPIFGGIGGLVGGFFFVTVAALAGEDQVMALRTVYVVLLAGVYDAVVACVLFPAARWATRGAEVPVVRGAGSL